MSSIDIGFPILDVDECVGWEELENWLLTASEKSYLTFRGPFLPCVLQVSFQLVSCHCRSYNVAM